MARFALVHPNRKRLLAWLEQPESARALSADQPDSVTAHVEQCERCADKLEELSGAQPEDAKLDPKIGAALRVVFEPPAGINDRVFNKIDASERAAKEMNLFLGLFGIATDAADLMMPDDSSGYTRGSGRGRED